MNDDSKFEFRGREFHLSKIDVFKQFHIARRLAPMMGELAEVAPKINALLNGKQSDADMTEEQKFEVIAKMAKPVMNGLSSLSDEDADIVLKGLCEAVEVKQANLNTWAHVVRDGKVMFSDLDFSTLIVIAGRSFMYNLAGFFNTAPQTSHGKK